jgi:hypothetical protein
MRPPDDLTCAVCGQVADSALLLTECFDCARWFHLNPYSNQPGKDCGDAGIGPNEGVETFCQDCLDAREREYEARLGRDRARAESMARSFLGDGIQLPPSTGSVPSEPARRALRRVEDE